jgi:hypothetical protein
MRPTSPTGNCWSCAFLPVVPSLNHASCVSTNDPSGFKPRAVPIPHRNGVRPPCLREPPGNGRHRRAVEWDRCLIFWDGLGNLRQRLRAKWVVAWSERHRPDADRHRPRNLGHRCDPKGEQTRIWSHRPHSEWHRCRSSGESIPLRIGNFRLRALLTRLGAESS